MITTWPALMLPPTAPVVRALSYSRLITPPTEEPLTLDEGKLWAGFDWPASDPREALMTTIIAASRAHLEEETGIAFLTQTRECYFYAQSGRFLILPPKCHPIQSVTALTWIDGDGVTQPIDPTWYSVDPGTGYLTLGSGFAWPSQLITARVVAGWPTVGELAALEPRLIHLVGRLVAHNMTLARDLAVEMRGTVIQSPGRV